jgi:Ion channel
VRGERTDAAQNQDLVLSLALAFRSLRLAFVAVLRDPETRALPVVAGALLLTGTIFYWRTEDWTIIQALYFSVVTLTTVGYGDLTGLGVFVALLASLADKYIEQKSEGGGVRGRLRERRQRDRPAEDAGPQ